MLGLCVEEGISTNNLAVVALYPYNSKQLKIMFAQKQGIIID